MISINDYNEGPGKRLIEENRVFAADLTILVQTAIPTLPFPSSSINSADNSKHFGQETIREWPG